MAGMQRGAWCETTSPVSPGERTGPRPVRPGDELRVCSEVLEVRPSKSRPTQGMVKVRITTLNQNDEAVQVSVSNIVVKRRP